MSYELIITKLQAFLSTYGVKIIAAVVILFLGWIVSKIIRAFIKKLLTKMNVDTMLVSFSSSIAYVIFLILFVIAALGKIGIQTTSFIAVLGAAGLAIGMALQSSLSNFAAGILMIVLKPFKTGDFIECAGTSGTVQEIGFFTMKLKSPDNREIFVPNGKVLGENIVNYSANSTRRIDLIASASYNDNIDKVKSVLTEILDSDSRILKDPAPTIGLLQLGSSSVDFAVRPWVKTSDYWDVYFSVQENIKKRFDEEHITIPFPQQDLHIDNVICKNQDTVQLQNSVSK